MPRQNLLYGLAFPATSGTTQGSLVSPTLLNVVVDNFIRIWLAITVEDQRLARDRLVETVLWCLGVLYPNDCMVGSQNADWLKHSMNILVGLFQGYGLAANFFKSRTMMCKPGAL